MKNITHNPDQMAMRLTMAIKRLRTRMREVAGAGSSGLSISQLTILQRLRTKGPATAASLASTEHMSQQAIAQNLTELKHAGLVKTKPDLTDGRKNLISVTKSGHNLFESAIASRNAWLLKAIDSTISAKERPALDKAIELLERLANTDHLE